MDQLKEQPFRILLTGSNGFLGQKFTDLMVAEGKHVLCCTSQSANRNPNHTGYEFKELDLLDEEALIGLLDEFQPTHILHTAALTSVEACEQEESYCKKLNVDTVSFLANYCAERDVYLCFLSTDFVFDGKQGPYSETDACNPCNAYGQSKLLAEEQILASGARASILRTILVYGVIADKKRSNLVLWSKGKLEAGEAINVVDDQWRMPTWVDDLARACLLAMTQEAEGIYHISSEKLYSIIEAVELVADYWGLNKQLIHSIHASSIGQATNRPRKTGFILNKAKHELGFRPTSFTDSLQEIDRQIQNYK